MDELFKKTFISEGSPNTAGVNTPVGYQNSYADSTVREALNASTKTDILVTKTQSTVVVDIEPGEGFDDSKSDISSSSKIKFQIELEATEFHKLPHDLVLWALTGIKPKIGNRDAPLDSKWKFIDNTRWRNITPTRYSPDFIEQYDEFWGVFELGTSQRNTQSYFNEKAAKYINELIVRSQEKHTVFVILVLGLHGYTTNIQGLSPEQLGTLLAHYMLGLRIIEKAKSLGWTSAADEKYRDVKNAFNMMHDRINADFPLPASAKSPIISDEMIEFWKNDSIDVRAETWKYFKILKKAGRASLAKRLTKSDIERMEPLIQFKEKMMSEDYRNYEKAPIQHPFALPLYANNNIDDYVPRIFYKGDNLMGQLWNDAMSKGNDVVKKSEDVEIVLKNILEGVDFQKEFKQLRRQKNRVSLEINTQMRLYLAKHGVLGKKVAKEYNVQQNYEEQKKPFSWFTPTDDIDTFKSRTVFDLLNTFEGDSLGIDAQSEKLRNLAKTVWPNQNDNSTDFINLFNTTKMARCLWFFDQIIQEVNLSVNQLCNTNQFVLKKISKLNAYLLIKPTNADGKTNYSVLYQKSDFDVFGLPFKEAIDLGDWVCTDFVSVDRHKLSHYAFSLEKMTLCFATWCDIFSIDPTSVLINKEKHREVIETFAINMLLFMESKGQTSYNFMLARYTYMEATKGTIDKPEVFKMFKKMDPRPKSRLLLWYYKQMEKMCMMMAERPVIMDYSWREVSSEIKGEEYNDVKSNPTQNIAADRFRNLISFISLKEIPKFEIALNLSYLGSWHNKDEQDRVTGFLKIYTKVIEQEKIMPDQRPEWMGFKIVDELDDLLHLKDHEFDQKYVRCIGKIAKEWLDKQYGVDYKTKIKDELMKKVSEKTAETLSTYKASAVMSGLVDYQQLLEKRKSKLNDAKLKAKVLKKEKELQNVMDEFGLTAEQILKSQEYEYLRQYIEADVPDNDRKTINKRRKVLEGIIDIITHEMKESGYSQPLLLLDKILKSLKDEGGVYVNLFKKPQLGGVREIFVMTIRSRLAILYIELISRIISKDLPHDTQAKPSEKATRGDAYFNKINATRAAGEFTNESSSMGSYDQTTWCQKFVNPVFSALLSEMLPDDMHHVTAVIHNLFTEKKLELPEELLDLFYNKSEVTSFDENLNKLKAEWLGKEKGNLTKLFSIFLKNESNMMQGVQHFTSNALHACHCMMIKKFIRYLLEEYKEKGYLPKDTLVDSYFEVSSDDSSMTVTVLWKETEDMDDKLKLKIRRHVSWFHHTIHEMKVVSYPLICSKDSAAKSTACNMNLIKEFNSSWEIRNTKLSPVIKFCYSGLILNVTSRIEDRQLNFSNARKQIVENGGSFLLSSICQELQARMHYKTLGADVAPDYFKFFSEELLNKPHPSLGFFIYEPEYICGTLGYDYAYYSSIMALDNMNKMEQTLLTREGAEINELGKPSVTVNLLLGQNINYNRFLNNLKIPKDWKDEIIRDPYCLFYHPRDEKDSLALIYKKALTPSSAQAFSFSTGSKLMASSVYVLQTNCITVREREILESTPITEELTEDKKSKLEPEKEKEKTKEFKSKKISLIKLIYDLKPKDMLSKDMIDLLFPARYYYDQANSIIFKYKLSIREPLLIKRPNKSVTVIIPRMQRFCSIDLVNVCQFKWFTYSGKGSQTDLNRCFIEYQTLYPWLADTWQESVMRSPFKDVFSMADFIRSLSATTGTFKVLGPIKRGLPFNLQIEQMIKLCFYKDKLLRVLKIDLEKISNAEGEQRVSLSELNSKMLILLTAPFPNDLSRKIEITKKIIKSESILSDNWQKSVSQMARMSDREIQLAVIQKFIKEKGPIYLANVSNQGSFKDTKKSLSFSLTQMMITAKHGTFAYFNKEQKQDLETGRWYGVGQITGTIDGMSFTADVQDDSLTKIMTFQPQNMATRGKQFKKLMNGFGFFNNGKGYTKTKLSYDLVNGSITSYKFDFIPVVEAPFAIPVNIDDDTKYPKEYNVFSDGRINLRMQADKSSRRFCTMIEYMPSKFNFTLISDPYVDLDDNSNYKVIKTINKDPAFVWTSNKSIEISDFKSIMYELVNALEDNLEIKRKGVNTDKKMTVNGLINRLNIDEKRKMRDWLKKTLNNRAVHKGIKSSSDFMTIVEEIENNTNEDEIDDFFAQQVMIDDQEDLFGTFVEEINAETGIDFDPENIDFSNDDFNQEILAYSHIESKQVEVISKRLEDITSLHPFWDYVISDLYKAESPKVVSDLILGKFKVKYDDKSFGSTSFYISWLMSNYDRQSTVLAKKRVDFVPEEEFQSDEEKEADFNANKMEQD